MKKFLAIFFMTMIFFAGCGNEEAVEFKTEKISAVDGVFALTHDGKISLSHELMIYSNTSGKVLEKYFKDGDDVKEGQKLFRIGKPDTEAELLQTKAKLGELMTTLAKEMTQKNSVEGLQAEIAELRERVKILEDDLAAGIIHAPIKGQLGVDSVRLGDNVSANETILAKIGRSNPVAVRFEISAAEKNFLSASKPKVSLKFSDGTIYPHAGTINFINDTTAETTFENPDGKLILGDAVQIELDGVKISNALLVPENLIQQRDGENFILVVDENKKAVKKKVSLGGKTGNQFIISDGLTAGDSIIIEDAPNNK